MPNKNIYKCPLNTRYIMVVSQYRARLKSTGSMYRSFRKKRQFESGSLPTLTKIGARKSKSVKTLGGSAKSRLMQTDVANVLNKKTNKFHKAKVISVLESPSNKHYVRRNIITKGAVISTDLGKARVTNRPGQEGQINAVLV